MPEKKSEPPDTLPSYTLGSDVLDKEVYSPVEFTMIWMPEEKSESSDVLSSDALGFCTTIVSPLPESKEEWQLRSTSVEKSSHEWKSEEDDNVFDEKVYSPVEFTLIRTPEEKSEPSNALPSYALGSAVLGKEVYSPIEFTLIWTPKQKSKLPDVLPFDALGFCTTIVSA
ncbi:hypothetical protein Q3G72_027115 [Acer saccharum]|nr:hypothetical protein Q3G72_027115 [Acer saccharum]